MTWVTLLMSVIDTLAMPIIGALALLIARQRFKTADRNRLEDQFLRGAALMDPKNNAYTGRVAGAVTLADIAIKNPDEYDKRVMRVFETLLEFPARYGSNHEKEGQVDYTSRDTVTMLEAIEMRGEEEKRKYTIRLNEGRPFRVNAERNVEKNPEYNDPATHQR